MQPGHDAFTDPSSKFGCLQLHEDRSAFVLTPSCQPPSSNPHRLRSSSGFGRAVLHDGRQDGRRTASTEGEAPPELSVSLTET